VLEGGVVLKDEADVAPLRRKVGGIGARDLHPPGVRRLKARDDVTGPPAADI
jgi:hypothetical protein